ncbi:MAG TPA: response regulator [Solirubrobacteraceae bacterium]|jgi:response regulator of citrate/malate metabolism
MIRTVVVDDDALVADVHRSYVERVPGFAVVGVAHRGAEALALVDEREADLLLLDFYLPDIKGLDVCRALKARSRRPVDVIAVTAARDVETVRSAVAHGVVQYLIKPFSFATFRERLERYAAYRARLERREEADQAEVDGLLGTLRAPPAPRLPKGLSKATYELVADVVRGADGDLSASEVADAAGLSRVSARRYLEHLAAEGLVELGMRYGTTGRPEHRYRWRAGRT